MLRRVLLFGVKRSRHRQFKGPITKCLLSATARSWFGSVGRSNAWYSPMPFPSVSKYAFTNTPALAMTLRLVISNRSHIFFDFVELHMATFKRKSRTFLPEPAQLWTGRSDPIKFPPSPHFLPRVLSQRWSQSVDRSNAFPRIRCTSTICDVFVLTYDAPNVEKYSSNIEEITMSDLVLVGSHTLLICVLCRFTDIVVTLHFRLQRHRGTQGRTLSNMCWRLGTVCEGMSISEWNELSENDLASLE